MRTSLFLAVLFICTLAQAQSPEIVDKARDLVRDGLELQKQGKHTKAIARFDAALALIDHPKPAYFKAISLEKLNRKAEAFTIYKTINGDARVGNYQAEIESALARLADELYGSDVTITSGAITGATVMIDGKSIGTTPLKTRLIAGSHDVSVTHPDYVARQRTISVEAKQRLTVNIELEISNLLLLVSCPVAGARILVDGWEVARTPQKAPVSIPNTARSVRVEKPGFKPFETALKQRTGTIRIAAWLEAVDSSSVTSGPATDVTVTATPASELDNTWAWVSLISGIGCTGVGGAFLIQHGLDLSDAREETEFRTADEVPPRNAIIGGIAAGVGVGLIVTSIFLFSDEPETSTKTTSTGFVVYPTLNGCSIQASF